VPRNPFINAGALAITDHPDGRVQGPAALVRGFAGFLADEKVEIDEAVAASELANAWQNRAIANLMRGKGTISHDPEAVVAAYCRQCALTMSCRQLARAMLPLAAGGFSPVAQETVFPERLTRRLNALLLTCGIYDSVGNFAYRVGLPAKSGVGGGIVAVIPGKATDRGVVAGAGPVRDLGGGDGGAGGVQPNHQLFGAVALRTARTPKR
jgi:glutaminase